jgi:hypothetical protein
MMRKVIPLAVVILGLALSAGAEKSPLEHDFPDGYWDRELANYGRAGETYSVSLAVEDPAAARAEVESLLKGAGGKLQSFNDMSAHMGSMGMDPAMMRLRAAYSMSYQLPEAKAAAAAKRLLGLGRLTQYSVGTPQGQSQLKEAEERIARIEKEKADNVQSLRTMPVSRALLESRLKRLRALVDTAKGSKGQSYITVQIMKELPEGERGGAVKP